MGWAEQDVLNHTRGRNNVSVKQSRARGVAPADERTYNGRLYHSKSEMVFAQELDIQMKCGAIQNWIAQAAYPIRWPDGPLICKLVVDFEILNNDGTRTCYEVKGHETDIFKLKLKLFRAAYPNVDYKIVRSSGLNRRPI